MKNIIITAAVAIILYQTLGLIISLTITNKSRYAETEENFNMLWTGGVPLLALASVLFTVSLIIHTYERHTNIAIIQDMRQPSRPRWCKHKDLPHFENSGSWRLIKRYATAKDIKAGAACGNGHNPTAVRPCDLQPVTKQQIIEARLEKNCYHCVNFSECWDVEADNCKNENLKKFISTKAYEKDCKHLRKE